ncbi:Epoxide hydrolase EphG [Sinobacterium norvegicum]|uniref:Epoxide hydrolase EphG n=1 Tax=Sinobacterium norvegicum TaxID=1641715 RepID=A0ABM9AJH7_9GAMM|nr:limonene-1,2-epoxide hydrolase family protein [Sinobacterium norvegicum]CAH0993390.1 Epoxide hydrolase EphG [Sinobacterium norvegicum]
MSNIALVQTFINAINDNKKNNVLAFFNDQSVFNNIPMGIVTGQQGVWDILGPLHEQVEAVEYVIHNIAESSDGVVLTERTDRYHFKDHIAEFPVMGTFEVDGSIIRQWRDYFDMKQCLAQLPKADRE